MQKAKGNMTKSRLYLYIGSSIKYVRKIFRKTNISNPMIRTHKCAYQRVKNISFSENFAYVLNRWPLSVRVKG